MHKGMVPDFHGEHCVEEKMKRLALWYTGGPRRQSQSKECKRGRSARGRESVRGDPWRRICGESALRVGGL